MPRKDVQKRTCLTCGKLFKSDGPSNRRCNPCAKKLLSKPVSYIRQCELRFDNHHQPD